MNKVIDLQNKKSQGQVTTIRRKCNDVPRFKTEIFNTTDVSDFNSTICITEYGGIV